MAPLFPRIRYLNHKGSSSLRFTFFRYRHDPYELLCFDPHDQQIFRCLTILPSISQQCSLTDRHD